MMNAMKRLKPKQEVLLILCVLITVVCFLVCLRYGFRKAISPSTTYSSESRDISIVKEIIESNPNVILKWRVPYLEDYSYFDSEGKCIDITGHESIENCEFKVKNLDYVSIDLHVFIDDKRYIIYYKYRNDKDIPYISTSIRFYLITADNIEGEYYGHGTEDPNEENVNIVVFFIADMMNCVYYPYDVDISTCDYKYLLEGKEAVDNYNNILSEIGISETELLKYCLWYVQNVCSKYLVPSSN